MPEYKYVDFDPDKIQEALKVILMGACKRVDVSNDIKVYECKNVIRIDLKIKGGDA